MAKILLPIQNKKKLLRKVQIDHLPEPEFIMIPINKLRRSTFPVRDYPNFNHGKFQESLFNNSYGILTVAHFSLDIKEIIDGNKRYEFLLRNNIHEVRCLDYGNITHEQRVKLAEQLNHNWYE